VIRYDAGWLGVIPLQSYSGTKSDIERFAKTKNLQRASIVSIQRDHEKGKYVLWYYDYGTIL